MFKSSKRRNWQWIK